MSDYLSLFSKVNRTTVKGHGVPARPKMPLKTFHYRNVFTLLAKGFCITSTCGSRSL